LLGREDDKDRIAVLFPTFFGVVSTVSTGTIGVHYVIALQQTKNVFVLQVGWYTSIEV